MSIRSSRAPGWERSEGTRDRDAHRLFTAFVLASAVGGTAVPEGLASGESVLPNHVRAVDADLEVPGDGTTWAGAFGELEDALDAARASGGSITELWLRSSSRPYVPGRRRGLPNGGRDASFALVDGVDILGGFSGGEVRVDERPDVPRRPCVLSGDRDEDDGAEGGSRSDNCRTVLSGIDVGSTTRVQGLVIRGGNADIPGRTTGGSGGAAYLLRASPAFEDCVFEANDAVLGGAVGIWTDSRPTFVRCRFSNNGGSVSTGGAGYIFERSHARFVACRFEENEGARGGSVFNELSNPSFVACTFEANRARSFGGAIESASGTVRIRRCRFVDHGASDGGAIYADGTLLAEDCLFAGNVADAQGGAIVVFRGIELRRCTLVDNRAGQGGAAWLETFGSTPLFANTLFWGNEDASSDGSSSQFGGRVGSVIHCCVEGLVPDLVGTGSGTSVGGPANSVVRFGNSSTDPSMRHPEAGDYRLRDESPCIDAGHAFGAARAGTRAPDGARDLDGRSRRVAFRRSGESENAADVLDIGAFEAQDAPRYEGGAVGSGADAGAEPVDVLFINGSVGGPRRWIEIAPGEAFELSLDAAPGEGRSDYVLFVWKGADREPGSPEVGGAPLGTFARATPWRVPISSTGPRWCFAGSRFPMGACDEVALRRGPATAPFVVRRASLDSGVYTIQGVVADGDSTHPRGVSVTNAVTISVSGSAF